MHQRGGEVISPGAEADLQRCAGVPSGRHGLHAIFHRWPLDEPAEFAFPRQVSRQSLPGAPAQASDPGSILGPGQAPIGLDDSQGVTGSRLAVRGAPTGHAGTPVYGPLRAFWSRPAGVPWNASGGMARPGWSPPYAGAVVRHQGPVGRGLGSDKSGLSEGRDSGLGRCNYATNIACGVPRWLGKPCDAHMADRTSTCSRTSRTAGGPGR